MSTGRGCIRPASRNQRLALRSRSLPRLRNPLQPQRQPETDSAKQSHMSDQIPTAENTRKAKSQAESAAFPANSRYQTAKPWPAADGNAAKQTQTHTECYRDPAKCCAFRERHKAKRYRQNRRTHAGVAPNRLRRAEQNAARQTQMLAKAPQMLAECLQMLRGSRTSGMASVSPASNRETAKQTQFAKPSADQPASTAGQKPHPFASRRPPRLRLPGLRRPPPCRRHLLPVPHGFPGLPVGPPGPRLARRRRPVPRRRHCQCFPARACRLGW